MKSELLIIEAAPITLHTKYDTFITTHIVK
jgi:hypothetical protein